MITEFLLTTSVIFLSALYVPENQDLSQLLKQLDAILSQQKTYSIQREKRVDEIKERLETEELSADEGWLECGRIVDECLAFQTDTALTYALRKKEYAVRTGDSLKVRETDLNLAQIYSIMGRKSEKMVHTLSKKLCPKHQELTPRKHLPVRGQQRTQAEVPTTAV